MSRRGLAGLWAAAFLLAGTPGIALESAAGRAGAGPGAGGADAAAAPKDRTARLRCLAKRRTAARSRRRAPARSRQPAGSRRARCLRIERLAAPAPPAERLVPVEPPAQPPPGAPPSSGGSPPAPPPAPLPRFVSVAAREWSLTLSRPAAGAGSVTVELRNAGEDPHNLVVSPDDGSHTALAVWPETAPGELVRQPITLPAGRYLLFCSLEGHEAAGMAARLRVE